jgi:hypothetical protein
VIEHVVAFNDVRVVNVTKDLDLTADRVPYGVFVVSVDDFQSVEAARWTVDDFVDGASAAASDSVDSIEFRETELSTS